MAASSLRVPLQQSICMWTARMLGQSSVGLSIGEERSFEGMIWRRRAQIDSQHIVTRLCCQERSMKHPRQR